jgi:predicted nuclease with TOPRIM domain
LSKVYEIVEKYLHVENLLEEQEDQDTQEMLWDTLESIEGELEEKLEYLTKIQKNYEAQAEMFKAEKDRLAKKQQSSTNKAKNLKGFLEHILLATGHKKLETGIFTLSIQKNPPSLIIDDEDNLTDEFRVLKPVVDAPKLKKWAKDNPEEAEKIGVRLVQGESIRIK